MRLLILIIVCILIPNLCSAQYDGGSGDGIDQSGSVQLSLDGVPTGTQPLYVGGNGDGFSSLTSNAGLGGQDIASIYGGGSGDGFDRLSVSVGLSGQDFSGIFNGGDGDGFDVLGESFSLNGVEVASIFGGGDGDGFDVLGESFSLNGVEVAGIFGGGDGDGFDRFSISSGLMGASVMGLYGGGDGDGFDRLSISAGLDGFDGRAIFGGGNGDGFDREMFSGIVPLPLTLISFDAFPEDTYVLLKWVTEDEIGTDFFTIEKTRDGRGFTWVGEEEAAGFSEPGEQIHYQLKDPAPYQGTSFYRLKTTDFDGAISLSHLVSVHYGDNRDWNFLLFPNPNTGQHFTIQLEGETGAARMLIEVFDFQGRLILQDYMDAALIDHQRFDLEERLPSGAYLIRVQHPDQGQQSKILVIGRG